MKKMNEMTDEQLALSYIQGSNRAFDLLLQRNQSKLFAYIMFVVRDHDVADDVFQETFMKAITKLKQGKYTVSGKFSAWLMRIAHNVIMDMYREHKADKVVEVNTENDLSNIGGDVLLDSNVESRFVNEQVLYDVKKIVDNLPANQREVVYMRYYQQLSFKEIAELTNVSINTSLGRMRYALMNMRRLAKSHHVNLQLL